MRTSEQIFADLAEHNTPKSTAVNLTERRGRANDEKKHLTKPRAFQNGENTFYLCTSILEVAAMFKSNLNRVFAASRERIENCMQSDALRLKATAFVRNRKLDARELGCLLVSRIYKALQPSIDHFCSELDIETVSKQAVSKARGNLDPAFIRGFFDDTARVGAEDNTLETTAA